MITLETIKPFNTLDENTLVTFVEWLTRQTEWV